MICDEIIDWELETAPEGIQYEIWCPTCQCWHPVLEWEDCWVYCELCGEHPGILCPEGKEYDLIFNKMKWRYKR